VEPKLVELLVPTVLVSVTSAVVILMLRPPAMEISKYEVRPLSTTSPQVPDSVPVVISGRLRLVVAVMVMVYLNY
jgi:hypothetical protein